MPVNVIYLNTRLNGDKIDEIGGVPHERSSSGLPHHMWDGFSILRVSDTLNCGQHISSIIQCGGQNIWQNAYRSESELLHGLHREALRMCEVPVVVIHDGHWNLVSRRLGELGLNTSKCHPLSLATVIADAMAKEPSATSTLDAAAKMRSLFIQGAKTKNLSVAEFITNSFPPGCFYSSSQTGNATIPTSQPRDGDLSRGATQSVLMVRRNPGAPASLLEVPSNGRQLTAKWALVYRDYIRVIEQNNPHLSAAVPRKHACLDCNHGAYIWHPDDLEQISKLIFIVHQMLQQEEQRLAELNLEVERLVATPEPEPHVEEAVSSEPEEAVSAEPEEVVSSEPEDVVEEVPAALPDSDNEETWTERSEVPLHAAEERYHFRGETFQNEEASDDEDLYAGGIDPPAESYDQEHVYEFYESSVEYEEESEGDDDYDTADDSEEDDSEVEEDEEPAAPQLHEPEPAMAAADEEASAVRKSQCRICLGHVEHQYILTGCMHLPFHGTCLDSLTSACQERSEEYGTPMQPSCPVCRKTIRQNEIRRLYN